MKKNIYLLLIFFILFPFINTIAQIFIGNTSVQTRPVISNLDTPWEILWGSDNKIWFTERYGRVSRVDPLTGKHDILITIADVHEESEAGLMGMALHPSFPTQPYVYLVYTYFSGSIKERIVRYTYSDSVLQNPLTLLDNIPGAGFHIGSRIAVGPDNKLYVSTGDAINTSSPQDINSVSGKILRLNLDGSKPDDNPIANNYLWTFGHRNPQGLVFTPDGKLYTSEHGPNDNDEINIMEKGRNYGWPDIKGFCDTPEETTLCNNLNVKEPLVAWTPTLAVCGIDYYNNLSIPEWQNSILMTTLKDKTLYSLKLSSDGLSVVNTQKWFINTYGRLRDVCVAPDGRVFIATSNKDGRGSPVSGDDKIIEIKSGLSAVAVNNSKPFIKIYPNPLRSVSIIEVNKILEGCNIAIYNNLGTLVFTDKIKDTKYSLSKSYLSKGFYIIKFEKKQLKFYQTFIVL